MRYKGKACKIVGEKEEFLQRIVWIRLMEDGSFYEVPYDVLEKPSTEFSMPYLRFVSIAAKKTTLSLVQPCTNNKKGHLI